jgi:hypothetical protein
MTCTDNVCKVPGCSGEWTDTVAQNGAKLSHGGGLVVDAQGTVHATWTGGGSYAKKPAGGSWSVELTSGGGWNSAFALDPSGGAHISFVDSASGTVRVSSRPPGATSFTQAIVDSTGSGQLEDTTSIAADAQGGLHVRYLSQGALKYAHRAPGASTWSTEIAAGVGYASGSTAHGSNSLAVDAQGGVHVVYFASYNSAWYAYRAPGGGWSTSSLDEQGSLINAPPYLALDAQGGVHVVYLAALARQIRHAYKPSGGSFTLRTLVTEVEQIFGPAFAVSGFGTVHVSYQHEGTLYYLQAPPTGTSLDFYNVLASGMKISEYSRIALDEAGGVHVTYERDNAIRYAYRCPGPCPAQSCAALGANCGSVFDGCKRVECGSCSDPTLCGAGGVPNQCCTPTTCAAAGKECGAISDGCGSLVDCGGCSPTQACGSQTPNLCGACEAGDWTANTVSSLGNVGWPTAIALDAQAQPHIVFGDDTNVDVVYARYVAGAGWQTSLVDGLSGAVYRPSGVALDVDPQGGLHAAYSMLVFGGNVVRYAYRAPAGTSWSTTDVATGLDNFTKPALRLDAQGGLHLAYFDGTAKTLVYASRAASGGAWSKQTIASAGSDVTAGGYGELIALALDASGGVHVSYSVTSFGGSSVTYAHRPPGGSFSSETVVPGSSSVAKHTAIAVESSGRVHIAYSQSNDLRYATKPSGGTWSSTMIVSADYTEPSIAVDAQGGVHISFNADGAFHDLRYAYKPVGFGWITSDVDTQGYVGKASSVALDPTGGVHVSYLDDTTKDLKYAFRCPN